ncbi:hypothetical protein [Marinobacter sp.]|uniref:hypothetical protein n=1 Tax=Marinobacter sp. TaxID=50741 RepID=UPI003A8F11F2
MSKLISLLLLLYICSVVSGCDENTLALQVGTNQIIDTKIPRGDSQVTIPFLIPEGINESALSYAVHSAHSELTIELLDPDEKLIASSLSEEGWFMPAKHLSPNNPENTWGFKKIVNPTSGMWSVRFTRSTEAPKGAIPLQLSMGLVPKYSAFIKPYNTRVQVGQPILVEMRLSAHGKTEPIEGHQIDVFNEYDEKVDELRVSNRLTRADNVRINSTGSSYLAIYTPETIGTMTLKAALPVSIDNQPAVKEVRNSLEVVAPILKVTGVTFMRSSEKSKTVGIHLRVNVVVNEPIWLVARATLAVDGKNITTSRNKETAAGEAATFTFDISDIPEELLNTHAVRLVQLDFTDFNVEQSAVLLQSIPIEKEITDTPFTIRF